MNISMETTAPESARVTRPVGRAWWPNPPSRAVSTAPRAKFADMQRQDLPILLSMMPRLALQPPSLPFDENELRAPLEKFLAHSELGRAWLGHHQETTICYVILTHVLHF